MIISTVVSETKKEYAAFVKIAAVTAVCAISVSAGYAKVSEFISRLDGLSESFGIVQTLLKGAVICIMTQLVRDLCRDSANTALADAVEIGGRIMIVILTIPLIESVIKTALAFIN